MAPHNRSTPDAAITHRVLAIHRYYWPDTPPYATLLREIAGSWSADGHNVEVLSSQPSYKPELEIPRRPRSERDGDVLVRRIAIPSDRKNLAARLISALMLPLTVALRILVGRRRDVVMCSTAPPVVLAWVTALAARARGAAFIYHCMDIHPEIGVLSGHFRSRPVYAMLRRMDEATCRRAAAIVVLSDDMRDALLARDPALAAAIHVINNFDLSGGDEDAQSPIAPGHRTRLAFAGNVGQFQGLDALVDAVLASASAVELVIMGEGAAKVGLQARVDAAPTSVQDRVTFLAHGSTAAARRLIAEADFGVVSLQPEIVRYAYPSKTATYLSEGTPIVALVEPESELATEALMNGYGFAVRQGDVEGLGELVGRLASLSQDEKDLMSDRAVEAWRLKFSSNIQLPRWDTLLNDILRTRSRA